MKLADEARHWWKLWSVRILLLAAAMQTELILFPSALKGYLPDEWMHKITLGLLGVGIWARLIKQHKLMKGDDA